MTSVIVAYMFKNVFLTFYIRQAGPLKRREACDNLSPYSPSRWDWVLIMVTNAYCASSGCIVLFMRLLLTCTRCMLSRWIYTAHVTAAVSAVQLLTFI